MALVLTFCNVAPPGTAPDPDYADYEVCVRVADRTLEIGHVARHLRADGWAVLVQRYLDERLPDQP